MNFILKLLKHLKSLCIQLSHRNTKDHKITMSNYINKLRMVEEINFLGNIQSSQTKPWRNRLITDKEMDTVIKSCQQRKAQEPDSFTGKFHKTINIYIFKLFPKKKWRGGKTSQYILWNQHYSDTKISKDTTKENYRSMFLINRDENFINKI